MSDLLSPGPSPDGPPETGSNAAPFTVSELSMSLKRTVEESFSYVRVRGEISQPKIPGSGHCYLRLKDENSAIDGIIWRGTMSKLSIRPEEGMEVIASGRLTTYPARSSYQIIIDSLELAGQGALLKLLEDRRKKLAAEGLFDDARKQLLPFLPDVIGVVTSPTGAVIRDILHRIADRFPRRVIVWPVKVQGEGAANEIAAAIAGFNALPPDGDIPRPDVIIVARGGGSLEDLWCFNEENVVRAAAASLLPLISAVGHETDWTLIDYAADRRAPTPTAAAEMAVPVRLDLLAQVQQRHGRLAQAMMRMLEERRLHLEGLVRGIPRLDMIVAQKTQDLDALAERLDDAPKRMMDTKGEQLLMLAGRLNLDRFTSDLRRHAQDIAALADRAARALTRASSDAGMRLDNLMTRLESVSPKRVLERGYALVRDAQGELVTSAAVAASGGGLEVQFADGKVGVHVDGAPPKPVRPAPKKGGGDSGQGTLL
jgi:exodeoxyribonuclease VII large subunit